MKKSISLLLLLAGVFIYNSNGQACSAGFTYTNTGNSYSFTDTSVAGTGTILTRLWSFGDLSAPETLPNVTHLYANCGIYTASLTIFTSAFCSSTYTTSITVTTTTPPTFTAMDNGMGNVTFQVQPFNIGTIYNWTFGDATVGTGPFALHTYAVAGTYNVCLTATDSSGICTNTVCQSVTAAGTPGACNITFTNALAGGQMIFTATPLSITNTYNWNFGDLGTGTGIIANHTYTTSGTYTVCVTMNDTFNACSGTYCDTVQVGSPSSASVDENNSNSFQLSVFPNPMETTTTISYNLNKESLVELSIWDVMGNNITLIDKGMKPLGINTINFEGHGYAKGIYILLIKSNNVTTFKKLAITR